MLYNAETIGEGLRTTPVQTVRVCELVTGDKFIRLGVLYVVIKIADRRLYYRPAQWKQSAAVMSANSQERVEIIK